MNNVYFKSNVLLANFIERIKPSSDGINYILNGEITKSEYEAILIAIEAIKSISDSKVLQSLDLTNSTSLNFDKKEIETTHPQPNTSNKNFDQANLGMNDNNPKKTFLASKDEPYHDIPENRQHLYINYDCLKIDRTNEKIRVCLDFGTAMSKATLVDNSSENEEIEVLQLGLYTDQEEINEYMMMSSIYITQDGFVLFGKKAWDYSLAVGMVNHQRIDNIKMYLLDDFDSKPVDKIHNPTATEITYETLLIGILGFLSFAINKSLDDLGYSRYISRRFAYPCPSNELSDTYKNNLKKLLLYAQILADTYSEKILEGIALQELLSMTKEIKNSCLDTYPLFITEGLTEPVGVAGSLISWTQAANTLALIVDIGAGTTDITMYRLKFDPETQKSIAREISGTSRTIDIAGDYLDQLLIAIILSSKAISFDNPKYNRYVNELKLDIRNTKELLFLNGSISNIFNDGEVYEISLQDFLNFKGVKQFTNTIKEALSDIIYNLDESTIRTAPNNAIAIFFTGGGAELPMIDDILEHKYVSINHPIDLRIARVDKFPRWLKKNHSHLEEIYPRVAVSLGGARKKILNEGPILKKSNF